MYCINRPPNKLPNAFESAGKTISLRSDCDSATVRTKTESLIAYKSKSTATRASFNCVIPPKDQLHSSHIPL